MRKHLVPILVLQLALALTSCGGNMAPAAATVDPLVNVSMTTNPNPASVGDIELDLLITSKDGTAIECAKVEVNADHPEMSGMSMNGSATEQGGGKYAIKANFDSSGDWKITVAVTKGDLNSKQVLDLKVNK
jgi:hypothetical protein